MSKASKILLIFDLNQTLLFAGDTKTSYNRIDALRNKKPNDTFQDLKLFYRGGRNEFLDNLFRKNTEIFDIGVWSSLDREKTTAFSQSFFDRYYRNLSFIAGTNREDYEGNKAKYGAHPIPVKRNLGQIFEKFPQYGHYNTIVISNYKNLIESYSSNDLIVPKYCPEELGDGFDTDYVLPSIMKYLIGLNFFLKKKGFEDVRPIIAAKSFFFLHQRVVNNNLNYNEYF